MTPDNSSEEECSASGGTVLGCRLPMDPALKEQGWEWRCNADGTKLRNVVDAYEELGFEVRLEPLDLSGLSDSCRGCRSALAVSHAVLVRSRR